MGHLRTLAQNDLYFLLRYALNRPDVERQWLFDRCREVQENPNDRLDLWAREHYKSTVITFALTIQDILRNPDVTVGIFSHTRPIAKGFLRQIKREFEANEQLRSWFPEIFWEDPRKAPKWSEDDGLIVKRNNNPKEATLEAWGLVDGQPTSKHFNVMVYDDVVTRESVTTPDMIAKTTEAWELSRNLASEGEGRASRYIGTRYHFNDTYKTIMARGIEPRIYPATQNGLVDDDPVLLSKERLAEKRREMGPYTFASQMLQNPKADETQGFKAEWVQYHEGDVSLGGLNTYIFVDPANEKRKSSDYTAMWVIGLGSDENYYVLEMCRDRWNLTERTRELFRLHRKYRPKGVGYEKYGMQSDIEHIKDKMRQETYRFTITELGGSSPKLDRIRRLIPLFEQGRVFLPPTQFKTDYEGKTHDLTSVFMEEEYKAFPVALHDDMLDALARLCDDKMQLVWPRPRQGPTDRHRRTRSRASAGYMAA